MAIFNSYVKLPEGIYFGHVMEAILISGVFSYVMSNQFSDTVIITPPEER